MLQLVGPAVALHTSETLHGAFPDRFGVSENLRELVAAGKAGVYVWDESRPARWTPRWPRCSPPRTRR
ncbi:MAG: hypothetical protein WKF47_19185 [Geodermatophilaceae bacterium]